MATRVLNIKIPKQCFLTWWEREDIAEQLVHSEYVQKYVDSLKLHWKPLLTLGACDALIPATYWPIPDCWKLRVFEEAQESVLTCKDTENKVQDTM